MTSLVSDKPAASEAISLNGELAVLRFRKSKRFGLFRNFRVISMRFAVLLCYTVRCLYVFLRGFAVFVPPSLRPLCVTKVYN